MKSHSVFVIDDDAAVRDSLVTLFRGEGMMARGFASGTDFFEHLPEDRAAASPRHDGGRLGHGVR